MIYLWCNEAHCDLVLYSAEVKHFHVVIAKEGVNIQVTVDCDLIWAAVCPSVYDTSVFYNTVCTNWSAELNKEKKNNYQNVNPNISRRSYFYRKFFFFLKKGTSAWGLTKKKVAPKAQGGGAWVVTSVGCGATAGSPLAQQESRRKTDFIRAARRRKQRVFVAPLASQSGMTARKMAQRCEMRTSAPAAQHLRVSGGARWPLAPKRWEGESIVSAPRTRKTEFTLPITVRTRTGLLRRRVLMNRVLRSLTQMSAN